MKNYFISVCIISHPKENMDKCLDSLKKQSYKNVEIVVQRETGRYSELRNKIIQKAKGEIIAFIDADCYASTNWLEEINKTFQDKELLGFFGKVCYELHGKAPSIATRIVSNDCEGKCTANAAFRAKILKKVRFDEDFNTLEDWTLSWRLEKYGKIIYLNDAVVFHTPQKWSIRKLIRHSRVIDDYILAEKKYGKKMPKRFGIHFPGQFAIVIFPFIIPIIYPIRSAYDLRIAIGIYLEKLLSRYRLWKNGYL